jgi:hypothetical protein
MGIVKILNGPGHIILFICPQRYCPNQQCSVEAFVPLMTLALSSHRSQAILTLLARYPPYP